ncbi:MAG: 4Fe-4S binding protein [Promethearchaeota archaeon]
MIDHDLCALCGTCSDICLMETIREENNRIVINLENCLGCGVCASNCPQDAIRLDKIRNVTPVKNRPGLFG